VTVVQLIIGPAILTGAFLGALMAITVVVARRHLAVLRARQREAETVSDGWQRRYRAVRDQEHRQGDVIAAVIAELESRRATYETFPQDLRESLYAAHDSGQQTERNTK
jgi:hypothetical protein